MAMSEEQKDKLRQMALDRHAARKAAAAAVEAPPETVAAGPDRNAGLSPAFAAPYAPPAKPTPRAIFTAWLRGAGRDAADTRLARDPVRLGAEIEDKLWLAWQAGFAEGRAM